MANKKGTCKNCGRENVAIVGKGLCPGCYNAQSGMTDERKIQDALAKARIRLRDKALKAQSSKTSGAQDQGANSPPEQIDDTAVAKADPPAFTLTEQQIDSTPTSGDDERKVITLEFAGEDLELYNSIVETARIHRRDLSQQVLYIIEQSPLPV